MAFTETFIAANMDKFPSSELPGLRQRLDGISQSQSNIVIATPLKNPVTALLLSLFFGGFGADRFYLGQIGLGILKFLSCCVLIGVVWVWADYFLIMGVTKKVNLEALNTAIATATASQN